MAGTDSAPSSGKKVTSSRVAGGYGARRVKAGVIVHGHISHEAAEQIWRTALSQWGIGGTTEESRDDLLWALAEVFVHGTSSEIDWHNVSFEYNGSAYSVAVLSSICAESIKYINPVRVFVRDFREAEIPMRISELLDNEENLKVRQKMVARYGATVDDARFCFDTSSALLTSGLHLKPADIQVINALAKVAITAAHEDAVSRGYASAPSDHSAVVGGSKPTPQVAPSPATDSGTRAGFKPVR